MKLRSAIEDLAGELREILTEAGLGRVTVTTDPREAPDRLQTGRAVIVIAPPVIEIAGRLASAAFTYEATIIAPEDHPARALGTLGPMLAALEPYYTEARPDTYHHPAGPYWYGYQITITP